MDRFFSMEDIVLEQPSQPIRGRVVACAEGCCCTYYRLVVPHNGKTWDDDVSGRKPDPCDHGSREVWVEDNGPQTLSRFRIGDWVEATRDRVRLVDPIPTRLVLEPQETGPGGYLPRPWQLRIPAIPWLDAWLVWVQRGLVLYPDVFEPSPDVLGRKTVVSQCSCGEDGCGSLWVRVDHDPARGAYIWSELSAMGCENNNVGPALSFDEEPYRAVARDMAARVTPP